LFCFSMNLVLSQHRNQKCLTPTMTFFSLFRSLLLFLRLSCLIVLSIERSLYNSHVALFTHYIALGPGLLGHACEPVATATGLLACFHLIMGLAFYKYIKLRNI
jgi:hypothetical protein